MMNEIDISDETRTGFRLSGPMGKSLIAAALATVAIGGYAVLTGTPELPQPGAPAIEVATLPEAPELEETLDLALAGPLGEAIAPAAPTTLDQVETADTAPDALVPTRILQGPPPVVPGVRPDRPATLVQLARGLTEEEARALPRPTPRPGSVTAAVETVTPTEIAAVIAPALRPKPRPDTPVVPTVAETEKFEELSPLILASSPRPVARSSRIEAIARTARVVARPAVPEDEVDVARREPLEALETAPNTTDIGIANGPRLTACNTQMARAIPGRPRSAAAGSAVINAVTGAGGPDRDRYLVSQILKGNVPEGTRTLRPVRLTGTVRGKTTEIIVCVSADYLAVGSDQDNIRVPLGLPAAMQVARSFDMLLPTTRIVDAAYRQADLRVAPSPMTPGPQMSSTSYFAQHDRTVDAQMQRRSSRGDILMAGHKKDLVIANRLNDKWGRVAIYGWHRTNGQPIQPLSTVHGANYADYSHGIRLVSRKAIVNGREADLMDLLSDAAFAAVLNSDGPLRNAARYAALN